MKTTTFSQDDLLFLLQQRNLVYNYNFLNFSNRGDAITADEYGHPDGWLYSYSGSGAAIGLDSDTGACRIVKSSDDSKMTFQQMISEFPNWQFTLRDQKVSSCVEITNNWTDTFEIIVELSDGKTSSVISREVKASSTEHIQLSHEVNTNATKLLYSIYCSTPNAQILINKAYANIGDEALDSLRCMVEGFIGERKQYVSTKTAPCTELSLCEESKKLSEYEGSYTRLSSFLNGAFGGDMTDSYLPDMRGYFSRVWDNGAGVDMNAADRTALGEGSITGDNVGTVEEDIFKEHKHKLKFVLTPIAWEKGSPVKGLNDGSSETELAGEGNKETRPKNIAELYTIKWA